MSQIADRQLLLGLLALQNGFVTRDQLLAAFTAWIADKSRGLDDILAEQQALNGSRLELLAALAAQHLLQHGNDPVQSLATLNSISTARDVLEQLKDGDLAKSLGSMRTPGAIDDLAHNRLSYRSRETDSRFSDRMRLGDWGSFRLRLTMRSRGKSP